MRDTVDKLLNNEANRLYEKSLQQGLSETDLKYLNALINTYSTFVGAPSDEDSPPEAQSTEALLNSITQANDKEAK